MEERGARRLRRHPRVASVIDVGSNTVLLLTLGLDAGGRARQRDAALATTRLGSGLEAGGRLDPAARARTGDAVRTLVARARDRGAARCWAFATGAARRARDGAAFAVELGAAAGCPMEVLSGDDEAVLAYAAVAHVLGDDARPLLAVDVGGATTELTLGRGAEIEARVSLPLGALSVTEHGAPGVAEVARVIAGTPILARARGVGAVLVCSGGTATALAALDLRLPAYDPAAVHGHRLAVGVIEKLPDRARDLPGVLDAGRARILPAGALILSAVAYAAGVPAVRVSEHGVRHAYLRRCLAMEGVTADLRTLWS